jgi:hypothetical protein
MEPRCPDDLEIKPKKRLSLDEKQAFPSRPKKAIPQSAQSGASKLPQTTSRWLGFPIQC